MNRKVGTERECYQCGHKWENKFKHIPWCPSCKHVGFNWKQEPDFVGEEWRDCVLLGKHKISNYGRLKSTISGNSLYIGKIFKGTIDRCGYIRYTPFFAHTLVSNEFIGKQPQGYQCNHKDGNKLNNHVSNLEYLTPSQHGKHSMVNNLTAFGSKSARSKLKESDISKIIKLCAEGGTHKVVGDLFGVDESNISCITRGLTWKRELIKYANQTI